MNKTLASLTLITTSLYLASCAHSQQPLMKVMPLAHNSIHVQIQNGTASSKNGTAQSYKAISFEVADNQCGKMTFDLANKEAFPLKFCYKKNILILDGKTKTQFYYSPLWQQGFTYPNMTTNDSRLRNVDVRIQIIAAAK